jgi:hypothetical protein
LNCGSFLRPDSYTAAKERLDYARVLIATSARAVVKKVEHLLVDGALVEVQIIEEWGYDLGDDACLLEDDTVSKASFVADEDSRCDPEASNQVDMMVDQMAKGVADSTHRLGDDTRFVKSHDLSKEAGWDQGHLLEPVVGSTDSSNASIARVAETEVTSQGIVSPVITGSEKSVVAPKFPDISPKALQVGSPPVQHKRTLSCPPASHSGLSGPWSLEWIRDHNLGDAGVVFSAKKRSKSGSGAG